MHTDAVRSGLSPDTKRVRECTDRTARDAGSLDLKADRWPIPDHTEVYS
jgi:hypothetical protein